jgi:hypothetical protein
MSTIRLTPEFLAQLHELAVSWGKSAAKRAGTELGPDPPIDFMDIEKLAGLVAAGVTEGTVAALLEQKAKPLTDAPCPSCGTRCPVKPDDRPLTLTSGQVVTLHEPSCHCPKCRRDFFPPPDCPASGRT